jgi:hypothetical protein
MAASSNNDAANIARKEIKPFVTELVAPPVSIEPRRPAAVTDRVIFHSGQPGGCHGLGRSSHDLEMGVTIYIRGIGT